MAKKSVKLTFSAKSGLELTEEFLLLFCEKNSDGTKHLILRGKDLKQRKNHRIHPNDMYKISNFLYLYPSVIGLDLSYNSIGDEGFNVLIENVLRDENNLKDLNLMMCDITDKYIDKLNEIEIELRSLRLNGNKIGTEGGKKLSFLVSNSKTLLHLDIGETDQTLSSVQYYIKLLDKKFNSNQVLRVLDLSRVIPAFNRYPYDSAHFAESIGNMLQYNESLIEIHLQKNQFDAHDIELMLLGLKNNKKLLMLDLGYNRIGDYGLECIANYLKGRPQLLGLNVAGNGIHKIGAIALSYGMPNSKIRLLDISFNQINPEGILHILYTIKKPYLMRMLSMWGNTFNHESNKVIQRMLLSKVLTQECLDIKIYEVDNILYAAYYPSDHYKHKYYNVMDYACPVELKIKRNYIPHPEDEPRPLVDFKYYPRLPPITKKYQEMAKFEIQQESNEIPENKLEKNSDNASN